MCGITDLAFCETSINVGGPITEEGMYLLIYEIILDALVNLKNDGDWLVEHFDETIYSAIVPMTGRRLMEIAHSMPEFSTKRKLRQWMFDAKVFRLTEMEKSMSPSRLSVIFGTSLSQSCMILKRLCNSGKLIKSSRGTYCCNGHR